MIEKFEDLKVWLLSIELTTDISKIFSLSKDFGLKDQICRSAVSIASNIAEGFERNYNKEYIRFLRIAKGSGGELRTQIYIARNIGYLNTDSFEDLLNRSSHISSMLSNLIKIREEKF